MASRGNGGQRGRGNNGNDKEEEDRVNAILDALGEDWTEKLAIEAQRRQRNAQGTWNPHPLFQGHGEFPDEYGPSSSAEADARFQRDQGFYRSMPGGNHYPGAFDRGYPPERGFNRSYYPGNSSPAPMNNSGRPTRGGLGNGNRVPRTEPRDRLAFSKSVANVYIPQGKHDDFDATPATGKVEGTQRVQCATKEKKVRKLDLFDRSFVASMDDNTFPRITAERIIEFVASYHGDVCCTIESKAKSNAPYAANVPWNHLFGGVKIIYALGNLDGDLLQAMFGVDPGNSLEAIHIFPSNPVEMDVQNICNLLPATSSYITLDASKFVHGDMIDAVNALCLSRGTHRLERLMLIANRFPKVEAFVHLIQALEAVTVPGACITLLTTNPPSDQAVASARGNGFSRGNIHRRSPNEAYETYLCNRGTRHFIVGFKHP